MAAAKARPRACCRGSPELTGSRGGGHGLGATCVTYIKPAGTPLVRSRAAVSALGLLHGHVELHLGSSLDLRCSGKRQCGHMQTICDSVCS